MDAKALTGKVILTVAPVGQSEESFRLSPKTPEQVASCVVACARSGAAMVHLHPRDAVGKPAHELRAFSRTLDLMAIEGPDIVIQGSTGGLSNLTLEERCIALDEPRVECASLNVGSINFGHTVYINTLPDAEYWAGRMKETGAKAELEIFDIGMFTAARHLADEGLLPEPRNYGIILGFEWGLPADAEMLEFAVRRVPPGAKWGVIHHGMRNFELLKLAIGLGACFVRVGFEDSVYGGDGVPVETNHALVDMAAEMITGYGSGLATPDEARQILGLTRRA